MLNKIVFPNQYIQGRNAIEELPGLIQKLGSRALIISTKSMVGRMEEIAKKCPAQVVRFTADCNSAEINRLVETAREAGSDVIVGVGGGWPMDTARVVGDKLGRPVITCPTVASTDAACAILSVVNNPKEIGGVEELHFCKQPPACVIADEDLIIGAKAELLAAGMADALSTWFEAESCEKSGGVTFMGGMRTDLAMTIARHARDTVLRYGRDAYRDCQAGIISPAFSKVVEANILVSGCGFAGCGLASAHGIGTTFELVPNDDGIELQHGAVVGFGILCGLHLNQKPEAEIEEIYSLFVDIGLPVTFAQMHYYNVQGERLDELTKVAMRNADEDFPKKSAVFNEPVEITFELVRDTMVKADAYGQAFLKRRGVQA